MLKESWTLPFWTWTKLHLPTEKGEFYRKNPLPFQDNLFFPERLAQIGDLFRPARPLTDNIRKITTKRRAEQVLENRTEKGPIQQPERQSQCSWPFPLCCDTLPTTVGITIPSKGIEETQS